MTNLVVSPATSADLRRVYGAIPVSVRAWKAELDGDLVGVGGVMLPRPPHAHTVFLKVLNRGLPAISVYKALLCGIKYVKDNYPLSLYAVRDCGERNSAKLLAAMGFVYDGLTPDRKERWKCPTR